MQLLDTPEHLSLRLRMITSAFLHRQPGHAASSVFSSRGLFDDLRLWCRKTDVALPAETQAPLRLRSYYIVSIAIAEGLCNCMKAGYLSASES